VCGDHVVIFSDKTIAYPNDADADVCWARWYRRAIEQSVKQIRGAERWINKFPDRIYLDPECRIPFPIQLPPKERRKIHGVAVALGAGDASRKSFGGGTGSLGVKPLLKGRDHTDVKAASYERLSVGDVDPNGPFVHVFDDVSLDIVLREMDTISDFSAYLTRKEGFIRSRHLLWADGEEDLLAYYLQNADDSGEHEFVHPARRPWEEGDAVVIEGGAYAKLLRHPQYIAKKNADEGSYLWDRLIETFTKHMMDGTTIVPEGKEFALSEHEAAIRYMALEPRVMRRVYSDAIRGALEEGSKEPRFTRSMVPPLGDKRETGYFFMTLVYPERVERSGGYDAYRRTRVNILETYALALLRKFPNLKRVIGIGTDQPTKFSKRDGSSEDMIMAEILEWSPELHADLDEACKKYNIMQKEQKERVISVQEYPTPPSELSEFSGDSPGRAMNRKQRRALRSRKTNFRR
jgi:hypothetical protein